MGYHLSIIRTKNREYDPIQLDELRSSVISNLGFTLDETQSPPSLLFPGNTPIVAWYSDGEIWAKNPSNHTIDQMITLAQKLNARVRGDEFKTYESSSKTYQHPDDFILEKRERANSMSLFQDDQRRQKYIRYVIIVSFILLGILGYNFGKWLESL